MVSWSVGDTHLIYLGSLMFTWVLFTLFGNCWALPRTSGHYLVYIQKMFSFIRASFCLMSLNEGSMREDRECWRAGHSREEVCWRATQTRLSLPWQPRTVHQSATLANLSPNDQRHITTRTGSSSLDRFGKSQTGMPRVHSPHQHQGFSVGPK